MVEQHPEDELGVQMYRTIQEGRGRVAYTFRPDVLQDLLKDVGVETVEELPEEFLRKLCYMATNSMIQRVLESTDEEEVGSLTYSEDDFTIRVSDVGSDMLPRLIKPADDTLWDPQLSAVDFEMRVFDGVLEPSVNAAAVGRQLLFKTLQPPDHA